MRRRFSSSKSGTRRKTISGSSDRLTPSRAHRSHEARMQSRNGRTGGESRRSETNYSTAHSGRPFIQTSSEDRYVLLRIRDGQVPINASDSTPLVVVASLDTLPPAVLKCGSQTPMVLKGWKDVAKYLGCGIRTVQRWEKLGVPVRRPTKGKRSAVMALTEELDGWLKHRSPTSDSVSPETIPPPRLSPPNFTCRR